MRARSRFRALLLCGLLALAGSGTRLSAHNAPGSALLLDFRSDRVDAELRLPLSELELAFGQPLAAEPGTVVARFGPQLTAYVGRHLAVRAPDGRAWQVEVRNLRVALAEQPVDLVVGLGLRPPEGAPVRRFDLRSDVISHEVMNHTALVSLRSDWNGAHFGDQPEMLGALRSFAPALAVDRGPGSAWRGWRGMVKLGAQHIAEGVDHLLFLLVLLLPAPLLPGARRWGGYGGLRHSAFGLARIVTAFTAGHSVTLLVGALGWLQLPTQPVEVAIAASILVSAAHALRPIFAGREAWVAAGCGLVHGLAFAAALQPLHLDPWHFAAALFAFNLGIELMQLAVVAVTVPWLVLLSRAEGYSFVRVVGAVTAGSVALGWIVERACGWPNPLDRTVANLASHAGWLVVLLAVAALGSAAWTRRRVRLG